MRFSPLSVGQVPASATSAFVLYLLLALLTALTGCGPVSSRGPGIASTTGTHAAAAAAGPAAGTVRAGAASVVITPTEFETFEDTNLNGERDANEVFHDTGLDRLWSPEEPGATGPDGAAGRAGVDDDGDGQVDERDEYLAIGSDDVRDPAGDDFDLLNNPTGTEGNGLFEWLPLAGFQGFISGMEFRPAQGVLDDLYARALVVEKDGTPFVLAICDLVGLMHVDLNPTKRRIEQVLGIPTSNIMLASTHCHSGPDVVGIWSGTVNERMNREICGKIVEAVVRAHQAMVPCTLRSTTVEPPSAFDPVTLVPKRYPDLRIGGSWGAQMEAANGYDTFLLQTDQRDPIVRYTRIAALRLDEAATGRTVATVVNWHDHPEVLGSRNGLLSSDYPGFLRTRVEDAFGGVCIFVSGTLGGQIGALKGTHVPLRDQSGQPIYQAGVTDANGDPVPAWVQGPTVEKIRSLGYVVADEAIAGLRAATVTSHPTLEVRGEDLDIDLENPLFQGLFALMRRIRRIDPRDELIPDPAYGLAGAVRARIHLVTLGDTAWITAPGEVPPEYVVGRPASVADYSHKGYPAYPFPAMPAAETYMPRRDHIIVGFANAYVGYLIHRPDYISLLQRGHPNYYEEDVSAGPNFGDNVGNKWMEMLGAPVRFSSYPIRP